MLAEDGRCKTLDERADGYVRAEACGVMVLQLLESIEQADDASLAEQGIVALLLSSAVNQDGRSSSLTAPNGPAQQEVLRKALANGNLTAADISGLSMHGTGTGLGDPIEVGAAAAVLMDTQKPLHGRRQQLLTLSSSKSWLGHAEPAAGIVGMLHAAFAASTSSSWPIAHLTMPSPYVRNALESSSAGPGAWNVPRQSAPMPRSGTAAAAAHKYGVSAFAFQGTNAHIVMTGSKPQPFGEPHTVRWMKQYCYVTPHPYELIQNVGSADSAAVVLQCHLSRSRLAYLWDHVVKNRSIMPAAAYIEAAASAMKTLLGPAAASNKSAHLALADVAIPAPLLLTSASDSATSTVLCATVGLLTNTVVISSLTNASRAETIHMKASATAARSSTAEAKEPKRVAQVLSSLLAPAALLSVSKQHQAVHTADLSATDMDGRLFHPAALDCVLQLGAASVSQDRSADAKVPTSVGLVLVPDLSSAGLAHAVSRHAGNNSTDYGMFGPSGRRSRIILEIKVCAFVPHAVG